MFYPLKFSKAIVNFLREDLLTSPTCSIVFENISLSEFLKLFHRSVEMPRHL